MAKETQPTAKIVRWIEGAMAQVAEENLIAMSRAATAQLAATADRRIADEDISRPLRDLLTEPVAELGGTDPVRDADAIFLCTTASMRRYVGADRRPDRDDVDHLVRFCLSGIGADSTKAIR
jgi:hypothetical protein